MLCTVIMDLITAYVEEIDHKYLAMKRDRLHPFADIPHQKWSARMNRANLKHIADGHPDALKLKLVHSYWLAKTHLLELHAGFRLIKGGKKRELRTLCKELRAIIFDGEPTLGGLMWPDS